MVKEQSVNWIMNENGDMIFPNLDLFYHQTEIRNATIIRCPTLIYSIHDHDLQDLLIRRTTQTRRKCLHANLDLEKRFVDSMPIRNASRQKLHLGKKYQMQCSHTINQAFFDTFMVAGVVDHYQFVKF